MKICSAALLLFGVVFLLSASPTVHGTNPTYPTGGILYPAYGASFSGPPGITASDTKRLIELLESIDHRLETIEAKVNGPVGLNKLDALTVAKTNCLGCHSPSKAEKVGGDFILFSDDKGTGFTQLNKRDRTRIEQRVREGTMPPNKTLDAEAKAALKW